MENPLLVIAAVVGAVFLGVGILGAAVSELLQSKFMSGRELTRQFNPKEASRSPGDIRFQLLVAFFAGLVGFVLFCLLARQISIFAIIPGFVAFGVALAFLRFRFEMWILWLGFRGEKLNVKAGIDRFMWNMFSG